MARAYVTASTSITDSIAAITTLVAFTSEGVGSSADTAPQYRTPLPITVTTLTPQALVPSLPSEPLPERGGLGDRARLPCRGGGNAGMAATCCPLWTVHAAISVAPPTAALLSCDIRLQDCLYAICIDISELNWRFRFGSTYEFVRLNTSFLAAK